MNEEEQIERLDRRLHPIDGQLLESYRMLLADDLIRPIQTNVGLLEQLNQEGIEYTYQPLTIGYLEEVMDTWTAARPTLPRHTGRRGVLALTVDTSESVTITSASVDTDYEEMPNKPRGFNLFENLKLTKNDKEDSSN